MDPGMKRTVTDANGQFRLSVPNEPITLKVLGKYVVAQEKDLADSGSLSDVELRVNFAIPMMHESLLISASALNPTIDQRNDAVYSNTLFSRDDQIFDTLAAGINTGQHEGGGKSLEIRRFGYNLVALCAHGAVEPAPVALSVFSRLLALEVSVVGVAARTSRQHHEGVPVLGVVVIGAAERLEIHRSRDLERELVVPAPVFDELITVSIADLVNASDQVITGPAV